MDNMKTMIANLNITRNRDREPQTTSDSACASRICPRCHGAGYTRANVPYGHPDFGKALICQCLLAERKQRQQQALLALSGISTFKRFQDATFESFKQHLPGCKQAYWEATNYASQPAGWLVLLGLYGCGKTHLAVSIAKSRIEAGDTVLLQIAPDLLDYLRTGFSSNDHDYTARLEEMRSADLLIIDDFGAHNSTPWANETFFQLLNYRYNSSMATVITSNNITLTGVDPRISSRLQDTGLVTVVTMKNVRDYRIYGDSIE